MNWSPVPLWPWRLTISLQLLLHDLAARLHRSAFRRGAQLVFDVRDRRLDLGEQAGAGGLFLLLEVALHRARLEEGEEQQDHDDYCTFRRVDATLLGEKEGPCRS